MDWPEIATFTGITAMYPWALHRTRRTGIDFPIYLTGPSSGGFVYGHATAPIWEFFRRIPYQRSLALMVYLTALAGACLVHETIQIDKDPLFRFAATAFTLLAVSYSARHGNITAICGALCVTPWGALAAACFKPYLLLFAALHAALGNIDTLPFAIASGFVLLAFWPPARFAERDGNFHRELTGKESPPPLRRYLLRKDNTIYIMTICAICVRWLQ